MVSKANSQIDMILDKKNQEIADLEDQLSRKTKEIQQMQIKIYDQDEKIYDLTEEVENISRVQTSRFNGEDSQFELYQDLLKKYNELIESQSNTQQQTQQYTQQHDISQDKDLVSRLNQKITQLQFNEKQLKDQNCKIEKLYSELLCKTDLSISLTSEKPPKYVPNHKKHDYELEVMRRENEIMKLARDSLEKQVISLTKSEKISKLKFKQLQTIQSQLEEKQKEKNEQLHEKLNSNINQEQISNEKKHLLQIQQLQQQKNDLEIRFNDFQQLFNQQRQDFTERIQDIDSEKKIIREKCQNEIEFYLSQIDDIEKQRENFKQLILIRQQNINLQKEMIIRDQKLLEFQQENKIMLDENKKFVRFSQEFDKQISIFKQENQDLQQELESNKILVVNQKEQIEQLKLFLEQNQNQKNEQRQIFEDEIDSIQKSSKQNIEILEHELNNLQNEKLSLIQKKDETIESQNRKILELSLNYKNIQEKKKISKSIEKNKDQDKIQYKLIEHDFKQQNQVLIKQQKSLQIHLLREQFQKELQKYQNIVQEYKDYKLEKSKEVLQLNNVISNLQEEINLVQTYQENQIQGDHFLMKEIKNLKEQIDLINKEKEEILKAFQEHDEQMNKQDKENLHEYIQKLNEKNTHIINQYHQEIQSLQENLLASQSEIQQIKSQNIQLQSQFEEVNHLLVEKIEQIQIVQDELEHYQDQEKKNKNIQQELNNLVYKNEKKIDEYNNQVNEVEISKKQEIENMKQQLINQEENNNEMIQTLEQNNAFLREKLNNDLQELFQKIYKQKVQNQSQLDLKQLEKVIENYRESLLKTCLKSSEQKLLKEKLSLVMNDNKGLKQNLSALKNSQSLIQNELKQQFTKCQGTRFIKVIQKLQDILNQECLNDFQISHDINSSQLQKEKQKIYQNCLFLKDQVNDKSNQIEKINQLLEEKQTEILQISEGYKLQDLEFRKQNDKLRSQNQILKSQIQKKDFDKNTKEIDTCQDNEIILKQTKEEVSRKQDMILTLKNQKQELQKENKQLIQENQKVTFQ